MRRLAARTAEAIALITLTACSQGADRDEASAAADTEAAGTRPSEATDSAILTTARGFGAALSNGDSMAVIALLHPDASIFESGHAETREEYQRGHLAADLVFASAVRRQVLDERVVAGQDMALYTSEYAAMGDFRGRAIDAVGTETIVLVRTPEGWKIRHIHWSSH